jgi:hypothetical protein
LTDAVELLLYICIKCLPTAEGATIATTDPSYDDADCNKGVVVDDDADIVMLVLSFFFFFLALLNKYRDYDILL